MGLDVSWYSGIKYESPHTNDDYESDDNLFRLYILSDFKAQADGLKEGIYRFKESGGFGAGSYSGYNSWRADLARLIGKTDTDIWHNPAPGPFFELINFSDCEGVIGPKTSAKLAQDFKRWQKKADKHGDEWWRAKYAAFRKAFEKASDNGCVKFH